jgi:hypothetical protein
MTEEKSKNEAQKAQKRKGKGEEFYGNYEFYSDGLE